MSPSNKDHEQVLEPKSTGTLLTLQRGFRLLELIARDDGEVTAKGLSVASAIRLGTVYHLLRTMQEEGYVQRVHGGRYAIGPRVATLYDGLRRRLSPPAELIALLRDLQDEVDETVYISGWHGDDIVLQMALEGRQAVAVRGLNVGTVEHPHARASCKAILAHLPDRMFRAYIARRELVAITPNTVTDVERLRLQLDEIAERGFAIDREEFAEGVCCIAAPVLDRTGYPVASIALSAPAQRFEQNFDQYATALTRVARSASLVGGAERTGEPVV